MRFFSILLLISLTVSLYCIELSEPDPEDTRRITAIIQYTSEYRFGDNLNKGDEVVYEVNSEKQNEDFADHILKVVDKNDSTTTVQELFEGNELFVEFYSSTKEVLRIWGKDIAGGNHNLTLLSQNEVEEITGGSDFNNNPLKRLNKWKTSNQEKNYEVQSKQIHCREIELDIDKIDLPSKIKEDLQERSSESSVLLSNEVPKMLPLVPVAVPCAGKKELLMDNAGFVRNNNLKLKSYKWGE